MTARSHLFRDFRRLREHGAEDEANEAADWIALLRSDDGAAGDERDENQRRNDVDAKIFAR
jgi:hypothetical protein